MKRTETLHASALVIDAACPGDYWAENIDQWVDGGATCCFVTVASTHSCREAVASIAAFYKLLRDNDDRLVIALTVDDVRKAKDAGKLAVVLQFQGTHPLEYDVNLVELYWRLGVRVVQLAYNQRSPVCDGCEEPGDAGLSHLGLRVIQELNRLRMAIDLSHTGVRASFEALENSAAPCIVSHSNCRAVHENRRNLPDDLIRAIISADGVIGLNGFPGFVATSTKPTIDDLVDHMVHIDSIAGSGHVGLGLDYWQGTEADYQGLIADGLWHADSYPPPPYSYPAGIEDPSSLMQLTDRLVQRGYTDDEIRGVLGENWARVLETIWAKPSALS